PIFFSFNDTAPTPIYTLSLHDALPIFSARPRVLEQQPLPFAPRDEEERVVLHLAAEARVDLLALQVRVALHRVAAGHLVAEADRSEEHTSELQSPCNLVCRLLLEKKKK